MNRSDLSMTVFYGGSTSAATSQTAQLVTDGEGRVAFQYPNGDLSAWAYPDNHDAPFQGYQAQANLPLSGLVSFQTSDTHKQGIQLEAPSIQRLKRLRRVIATTAATIEEGIKQSKSRYQAAMVTLTYRQGVEWQPYHITDAVKCVKQWAKRRKIALRYVWVMELHKSGVPHYHLLLWVPRGITPPMFDKQGWWKHGMTNAKWAKKAVGYLVKYTSKGIKGEQVGQIPKGARLHGSGGLDSAQRADKCWLLSPQWVKCLFSRQDGARRVSLPVQGFHVAKDKTVKRRRASYWVNRKTGLGFRSPWRFDWVARVIYWEGLGWQPDFIRRVSAIPICRFPFISAKAARGL